jgi:hypothetical protein
MKHKSRQIDIHWAEPEAFALMVQTSPDGDRIATEQAQSEANKEEAEKQQDKLL